MSCTLHANGTDCALDCTNPRMPSNGNPSDFHDRIMNAARGLLVLRVGWLLRPSLRPVQMQANGELNQ